MSSRPLLSQLTRSYLAVLILVALFELGGYAVFAFGTSVQRTQETLVELSTRQIALVEHGLAQAARLASAEPSAAAALRGQLVATATAISAVERQMGESERQLPWWSRAALTAGSVHPSGVEPLLIAFSAALTDLAAEPDQASARAQSHRRALFMTYEPLAAALATEAEQHGLVSSRERALVSRLQLISVILVLGSLAAQAYFIFKPLVSRLADEQQELSLLSLVASKTDNGVVITDGAGRVVWVNEGFTRISGYTLDDMRGRTPGSVLQGEMTDPATAEVMRAAQRAGEPVSVELVNYGKDGRPYWLAISITPIRDALGRTSRFIAIQSDITERKRAEAALRERTVRLELRAEISAVGEQGTDEYAIVSEILTVLSRYFGELRVVYATIDRAGVLEALCSYEPPAMPALSGATIDLNPAPAFLASLRAGMRIVCSAVHTDPRLLPLADTLAAFGTAATMAVPLDQGGGQLGLLTFDAPEPRTWSDHECITLSEVADYLALTLREASIRRERARARAALRDSESTNRALLEALPDQMFRLNAEGFILGYKASRLGEPSAAPDALLGRHLTDLFPAELGVSLMAAVRATLLTGKLQLVEYALAGDEATQDYEARLTPVGAGEVLLIIRDISERKAGDRLKNEFVAMVSHELRTPLTSIRGSLGLIAGGVAGELPAQARAMIDIAHKNSERLVRLINDILDIEKIESGKLSFSRQPLELGSLMAQTIEANGAFGAQLGVEFRLAAEPGLRIFADPDRMVQVFTNLLSNAAKFSPAGEQVQVRALRRGAQVRVEVSDRGPGVPEGFRTQIFQRFAQADSSSTRAKGGTGLGLSIVRAIVERHGGTVGFESPPGQGATFFVELPAWQAPARDLPAPSQGRILICEDDRDVAHLLQLVLQRAGFTVEVAYSGAELRARLSAGDIDGLTLDVMLEHDDGVALVRELRAQPATADLPIVVVSGYAGQAQAELSGDGYTGLYWMAKPINPAMLVAMLKQAITRPPSPSPRVLHLDADPDLTHVVASLLDGRATVVHAASLGAARAQLADGHFDLAIFDLDLPDGSGLELLPWLQRSRPPIPAIIFSIHELEGAVPGHVDAVLVKSRVSNRELLDIITHILGPPPAGAPVAPKELS